MTRISVAIGALISVSPLIPTGATHITAAAEQVLQPAIVGEMSGYVFTRFSYALTPANLSADCPDGVSMSLRDSFIAQLPPADRPKAEQIKGFGAVGTMMLATGNPANGLKLEETETSSSPSDGGASIRRRRDPNRHTICNNPADFGSVGYRTIQHTGTGSGLNLDGRSDGRATTASCAHKKFTGPDGTIGVDNQFWRAAGCMAAYRDTGIDWDTGIRTGEWAVLMEVSSPKGGGPDGVVAVNFYSSKDSITLDAAGGIPAGLSLEYIDDPELIARAHGRIENGILVTEPIDFSFKYDNQIVHNRWSLEAARFRLKLMPDGRLKGQMGAYADVDKFYGNEFKAQTIDGANANNINCPGVYAALRSLADGHRDSKTGTCSAISVAFDLEAIPAFVIHPQQTADAGARNR